METLIKKNEDLKDLPVYLFKLDTPDRDGVKYYVFYRGSRHNWTSEIGALKCFEDIINNPK